MRFLKPRPFSENAVGHVGASRARKDAASGASAASFSDPLRSVMGYLSPARPLPWKTRQGRHAEPLRRFASESRTFSLARTGTTNDDSPRVGGNAGAFVSAQATVALEAKLPTTTAAPKLQGSPAERVFEDSRCISGGLSADSRLNRERAK